MGHVSAIVVIFVSFFFFCKNRVLVPLAGFGMGYISQLLSFLQTNWLDSAFAVFDVVSEVEL